MFFLLTEHSMVTTSLLPNWVSHFFISDVESFSSLNKILRAGGGIGTNSLSKKSLCKSQRPFSSAHCLIFALFLLTVLLRERKEEGRKLPGGRELGAVWTQYRRSSSEVLRALASATPPPHWKTQGTHRGPGPPPQPGRNDQPLITSQSCCKWP